MYLNTLAVEDDRIQKLVTGYDKCLNLIGLVWYGLMAQDPMGHIAPDTG